MKGSLWLFCTCVLALATSARLPGLLLLDLAPDTSTAGPHRRFTAALSQVRDKFENATATLSTVEADVSGTRDSAVNALVPVALRSLVDGIETLRRVRADVAADDSMAADVKAQVLWDVDRMVVDAERLRSESLAPLARTALMKALSLRFGVLLTPAFWSTPIKRDLLTTPASDADLGVEAAPTPDRSEDEQKQA